MADLNDVFQQLGELKAGQDNADRSRERIHGKIEKTDEFISQLSDRMRDAQDNMARQMSEFQAGMRDITVSLRLTNEIAVKVNNRLDQLEPVVSATAQFKINAEPIIKLLKQVRLYVIVLGSAFTLLGGTTAGVYAFGGDLAKAAIRTWLFSIGQPTP